MLWLLQPVNITILLFLITNPARQYTNNREMCETIFSSQTRQNVHISTPPSPPCPFQREYNGSLKNRKDGIVFSGSRGDPGLFVRFFLMLQTVFFLFQRVFFSECRNSLFRDRRTRFVLRDVERRSSKEVMNPVLCIPTISNF